MNRLDVTDAVLARHADGASIERGRQYWESGSVASLRYNAAGLEAEVWGSERQPYRVSVRFAAEGDRWIPEAAGCTCPYDYGGWCKHIVASLLEARSVPTQPDGLPTVIEQIDALSGEEAKALVRRVAETLAGQEILRPLMPGPSSPWGDNRLDDVRHEVRQAVYGLRGMRPSQAYWHVGEVVDSLRHFLDEGQTLILDDEADAAVSLLTTVLDEYLDVWTELDDSDGEVSGWVDEVVAVLVEAILAADLDPKDAGSLAASAEKWARNAGDYGVDSVWLVKEVLEQGRQRALEIEVDGDSRLGEDDRMVAQAWLSVLRHHGDLEEFLSYGEQTGHHVDVVEHLIDVGDFARAAQYLEDRRPPVAGGAVRIMDAWVRARRPHDALCYGQEVMKTGAASGIARRVMEIADALGDTATAWDAAIKVFFETRSLGEYRALKSRAAIHWDDAAPDILERIRKHPSSDAADIFLEERLIEDAMTACETTAWINWSVWERVGQAACGLYPDWVIGHLSKQAENIMNNGQVSYYATAAALLTVVRDAYSVQDNRAGWIRYKDAVVSRHGRKYRLMPLIRPL